MRSGETCDIGGLWVLSNLNVPLKAENGLSSPLILINLGFGLKTVVDPGETRGTLVHLGLRYAIQDVVDRHESNRLRQAKFSLDGQKGNLKPGIVTDRIRTIIAENAPPQIL
jgi:hypothetical protein